MFCSFSCICRFDASISILIVHVDRVNKWSGGIQFKQRQVDNSIPLYLVFFKRLFCKITENEFYFVLRFLVK